MSGQREATEAEMRTRIVEARSLAALLDERDGTYGAATYRRLADAVERVLDLCDEWEALRNEAANYYGERVRAALLGES